MRWLARFTAEWPLKLVLSLVLNLFFWTGYSLLGRHAFFPLRIPPVTALDRAIPYQPDPWGWVYLSQFLITGLLPWLMVTREEIRRYVVGFIVITTVSFALFIFFPVASPRSLQAGGPLGGMEWVLAYDGAFNAFPSLHAAFLVYMGLLARRVFRDMFPNWAIVVGTIWGTAILYATIATKQHYAVDLVAGALLGFIADGCAWRDFTAVAATTMRKSGVTSHDGSR